MGRSTHLRVREGAQSDLRGESDVPCAGRYSQRLLRLAAAPEVRGYRANETERAAFIRALSRRSDQAAPGELPLHHSSGKEVPHRSPADARKEANRGLRDGPITGKLLDHGQDHYRFDAKADLSYYVRVQTSEGKRTIWSEDFHRAIESSLSGVKIGDAVVIQHRGAIPVVVTRQVFDNDGNVIDEKKVSTHRNSWSVERTDFIAQRKMAADALRDQTLSPARISKNHPELAGALFELHIAELAARQRHNPRDREAFVARVRNALADEVARGEPLPTVQMRESRARHIPRERAPNTPVR